MESCDALRRHLSVIYLKGRMLDGWGDSETTDRFFFLFSFFLNTDSLLVCLGHQCFQGTELSSLLKHKSLTKTRVNLLKGKKRKYCCFLFFLDFKTTLS